MGILDRISTLLKSNLNSAIDKMTDPGKQIDQLVIEMEEQSRKARGEVQQALALEKRMRQKVTALEKSSGEWQERAERALKAGDEGLAREALKRKLDVDGELGETKAALDEQMQHADSLTQALKALDQRITEVKLRKETLKAQARAQKQKDLGTDAFAKYEQLVTGVDVAEAEVQLDEELAAARHEDAKSREVERKLEQMGKDKDVEDRLAALKAKMEKKD